MISYRKLFALMAMRGLKKKDIVESGALTGPTVTSLAKNESVTTKSLESLCKYLDCQPGDIMEYLPDIEKKEDKDV